MEEVKGKRRAGKKGTRRRIKVYVGGKNRRKRSEGVEKEEEVRKEEVYM